MVKIDKPTMDEEVGQCSTMPSIMKRDDACLELVRAEFKFILKMADRVLEP